MHHMELNQPKEWRGHIVWATCNTHVLLPVVPKVRGRHNVWATCTTQPWTRGCTAVSQWLPIPVWLGLTQLLAGNTPSTRPVSWKHGTLALGFKSHRGERFVQT